MIVSCVMGFSATQSPSTSSFIALAFAVGERSSRRLQIQQSWAHPTWSVWGLGLLGCHHGRIRCWENWSKWKNMQNTWKCWRLMPKSLGPKPQSVLEIWKNTCPLHDTLKTNIERVHSPRTDQTPAKGAWLVGRNLLEVHVIHHDPPNFEFKDI